MQPRILDQVVAVVAESVQNRLVSFTWMGSPIDTESFTDPQGFLPLLAAVAANVSGNLGVPPPTLVLLADEDSSFCFKLASLGVDPRFGLGPYLLALRDTVIEMDPAIEAYRDAIDEYLFNRSRTQDFRLAPAPPISEGRAARAE